MGFMNDASSGYKKYKNTRNYTMESMLEALKGVKISAGEPVMGHAMKTPSITYEVADTRYIAYVIVDDKNITVAKTLKEGESVGKNLFKELGAAALSNATAKDTAVADRVVDELGDVVNQLLETGSATSNVKVSHTDATKFYMKQKVISIKDKYDICDANQNSKYWVVGNLIGLSFSVQDASGNEIYTIKKKMIAVTPEYTLLEGGKEVAHIKKKIKLTRPEITGDANGKELKITGDMMGYNFSIQLGGTVVGNVDTERLTWGDCYSIEVLDNSLTDLIIAIAVICDNTLKNKD